MPRNEVFTLKHPEMVARHEAFVRKVVGELKGFDNLYYEICNEPYFGGVARLGGADRPHDRRGRARPARPAHDRPEHRQRLGQDRRTRSRRSRCSTSTTPARPRVIAENARLNKAIGDDETGFRGTADRPYRTEGWAFLLAGGSVYSNLDYSFTADHEDGTAGVVAPTPGGGGPALRSQLAILKRFLAGFDFLKMVPDRSVIASGVPAGACGLRAGRARPRVCDLRARRDPRRAWPEPPRRQVSGRVGRHAQRGGRPDPGPRPRRRPRHGGVARVFRGHRAADRGPPLIEGVVPR